MPGPCIPLSPRRGSALCERRKLYLQRGVTDARIMILNHCLRDLVGDHHLYEWAGARIGDGAPKAQHLRWADVHNHLLIIRFQVNLHVAIFIDRKAHGLPRFPPPAALPPPATSSPTQILTRPTAHGSRGRSSASGHDLDRRSNRCPVLRSPRPPGRRYVAAGDSRDYSCSPFPPLATSARGRAQPPQRQNRRAPGRPAAPGAQTKAAAPQSETGLDTGGRGLAARVARAHAIRARPLRFQPTPQPTTRPIRHFSDTTSDRCSSLHLHACYTSGGVPEDASKRMIARARAASARSRTSSYAVCLPCLARRERRGHITAQREGQCFNHLRRRHGTGFRVGKPLPHLRGQRVRRFGAHAASPPVPARSAPAAPALPDATPTGASSPGGLTPLRRHRPRSTTPNQQPGSHSHRGASPRPPPARPAAYASDARPDAPSVQTTPPCPWLPVPSLGVPRGPPHPKSALVLGGDRSKLPARAHPLAEALRSGGSSRSPGQAACSSPAVQAASGRAYRFRLPAAPPPAESFHAPRPRAGSTPAPPTGNACTPAPQTPCAHQARCNTPGTSGRCNVPGWWLSPWQWPAGVPEQSLSEWSAEDRRDTDNTGL